MFKRYFEMLEQSRLNVARAKRAAKRRQQRKVFTAFTLGSLISGVTALLFAPKPGKELRKDIADKTVQGAEFVKEQSKIGYERASKFTEEAIGKAKDKIDDAMSKIKKTTEKVEEEVEEKVEKAKSKAKESK